MAFWISVDPGLVFGDSISYGIATITNGCMHVVPGSHINGISPHGSPIDMEVPKGKIQIELFLHLGQEHAFYGMIEVPPKEKWVPIELEPGVSQTTNEVNK